MTTPPCCRYYITETEVEVYFYYHHGLVKEVIVPREGATVGSFLNKIGGPTKACIFKTVEDPFTPDVPLSSALVLGKNVLICENLVEFGTMHTFSLCDLKWSTWVYESTGEVAIKRSFKKDQFQTVKELKRVLYADKQMKDFSIVSPRATSPEHLVLSSKCSLEGQIEDSMSFQDLQQFLDKEQWNVPPHLYLFMVATPPSQRQEPMIIIDNSWTNITLDCALKIFSFCEIKDLFVKVPLVCSSWKTMIENPNLWNLLHAQYFDNNMFSTKTPKESFTIYYKALFLPTLRTPQYEQPKKKQKIQTQNEQQEKIQAPNKHISLPLKLETKSQLFYLYEVYLKFEGISLDDGAVRCNYGFNTLDYFFSDEVSNKYLSSFIKFIRQLKLPQLCFKTTVIQWKDTFRYTFHLFSRCSQNELNSSELIDMLQDPFFQKIMPGFKGCKETSISFGNLNFETSSSEYRRLYPLFLIVYPKESSLIEKEDKQLMFSPPLGSNAHVGLKQIFRKMNIDQESLSAVQEEIPKWKSFYGTDWMVHLPWNSWLETNLPCSISHCLFDIDRKFSNITHSTTIGMFLSTLLLERINTSHIEDLWKKFCWKGIFTVDHLLSVSYDLLEEELLWFKKVSHCMFSYYNGCQSVTKVHHFKVELSNGKKFQLSHNFFDDSPLYFVQERLLLQLHQLMEAETEKEQILTPLQTSNFHFFQINGNHCMVENFKTLTEIPSSTLWLKECNTPILIHIEDENLSLFASHELLLNPVIALIPLKTSVSKVGQFLSPFLLPGAWNARLNFLNNLKEDGSSTIGEVWQKGGWLKVTSFASEWHIEVKVCSSFPQQTSVIFEFGIFEPLVVDEKKKEKEVSFGYEEEHVFVEKEASLLLELNSSLKLSQILNTFSTRALLDLETIQQLTNSVLGLYSSYPEPNIVSVDLEEGHRAVVFGDFSGQFFHVKAVFEKFGPPSSSLKYIFNGDMTFVGGGSKMPCHIIWLALSLKIAFPNYVFLLRGNRDEPTSYSPNTFGGVGAQLLWKILVSEYPQYKDQIYKLIFTALSKLPFAALIAKQIFTCNGGPPIHRKVDGDSSPTETPKVTLDQIQNATRGPNWNLEDLEKSRTKCDPILYCFLNYHYSYVSEYNTATDEEVQMFLSTNQLSVFHSSYQQPCGVQFSGKTVVTGLNQNNFLLVEKKRIAGSLLSTVLSVIDFDAENVAHSTCCIS